MRSTFSGFEIAKSGIYTSQTALNVTGHNIANAETPGYTRQRLDLAAIDPYGTLTRFAPKEKGIYGGGVETLKVIQIRNSFIDRQFRDENSEMSFWSAMANSLSSLEDMFDIKKDNQIQSAMQQFMSALSDLQKDPSNIGTRTNVVSTGSSLAEMFRTAYEKFEGMRSQLNDEVSENIKNVNTLAHNIASLNDKIFKFEQTGHPANDLRDSRNLLLDELSSLVDISYSEDSDGKLTVTVGGETLVSHKDYNEMAPDVDSNGMIQVKWADSGTPLKGVTLKGGEILGRIKVRDGNTADEYGIPVIMNKLDELAKKIITEVNAIHRDGYTYPNSKTGTSSVQGQDFFSGTGAKDMVVHQNILDDPYNIAASAILVDPNKPATTGNNEIILEISKLFSEETLGKGDYLNFLKGMVSELGSQAQKVNTSYTSSFNMTAAYENQRLSVSGVSLDEEMTNLIKFQHAYSAAARALTTMDEALDVLINRTGRVGL